MKEKLVHYFMGVFPGLVLFLILPLTIYLPNQGEFEHQLDVLAPFWGVGLLWALLIAPFVFSNRLRRGKFFPALFFLGLFLLLKEIVAPLRTEGLFGLSDTLLVHESTLAMIMEFVLLAVLVLLLLMLSKDIIGKLLVPIALIFIALHLIFAVTQLTSGGHAPTSASKNENMIRVAEQKRVGNIYLVCLDGTMALNFQEVLKAGDLQQAFSGFTFFKNNMTNYTFTMPSIASILGATFYKKGSIKKWIEKNRERDGIIKIAADAGFNLWMYSPYKHASVPANRYVPTKKSIRYRYLLTVQLESVWLLRIVPTIFKKEVARDLLEDRKILKLANVNLVANSLAQFKGFAADEGFRPATGQFVYVHVYIPHKPYIYDADCREVVWRGNYIGQAACVLKSVVGWLDSLKRQGKYDTSTIIIFGDHGMVGPGTDSVPTLKKKKLIRIIRRIGDKSPTKLNRWATALLLVKPPADFRSPPNQLQVAERQTQNGDIAATLAHITGIQFPSGIGVSIFDQNFPENRDVDIFHGYEHAIYRKIKQSRAAPIQGALIHFKYNHKKGWRYVENIECVW